MVSLFSERCWVRRSWAQGHRPLVQTGLPEMRSQGAGLVDQALRVEPLHRLGDSCMVALALH